MNVRNDEHPKPPRLMLAAKEFNIGRDTLIDFLIAEGFNRNDLKPTSRLSELMYNRLKEEFAYDKAIKAKSEQIDLPPRISQTLAAPKVIDTIDLSTIDSSTRPRSKYSVTTIVMKCIKEKNPILDLGHCALTDEDLGSKSVISNLMEECKHIEVLILSNEWWAPSDENGFREFKKSSNTHGRNTLTVIPGFVNGLKDLTTLIIAGEARENGIKIHQIENLDFLTKLKYLDISNNRIEKIEGLYTLSGLQVLDLSENLIEEIAGLEYLSELRFLDLANNRIKEIKGISSLINLRDLFLRNNEISEMNGLENLLLLEVLVLSGNRIRGVANLETLTELRLLLLGNNEIQDIKGLEFLLEKETEIFIDVEGNPFLNLYQLKLEKNENHFPFIKELLIRQMDNSTKRSFVYPMKVLLLGNHATGKSSIVDYLTNQQSQGSTHILRIQNYYFKDEKVKRVLPDGIFYDFGGQDFYHGLYQAFITKDALQIIVFNKKTDFNGIDTDSYGIPIINFDRRFWLGQKTYNENYGDNSDPYLILQSFADTDQQEDQSIDYSLFPGFKKAFFLSLKLSSKEIDPYERELYAKGREYFKAYLNLVINKYQITSEAPIWYIHFLEFIINKEGHNHTPITLDQVLKQYKVKDLSDEDKLESLKTNLTTLHRHGLVLYYPLIKELHNIVWLNPQKLVEHIQNNILNKVFADITKHKKPGVISKSEFDAIVKDEKIISLLQEQKVIFLHNPTNDSKNEEYIIPNYLPLIDKESSHFQLFAFGLNDPKIVIKFNDFIPFGFINQVICFFGKEPDVKMFWRNQLLFTLHHEARVLIELDFKDLKIKVHFQLLPTTVSNEPYISEYIFFSLMALYWNFQNHQILAYDEFLTIKNKKGSYERNSKNDKFEMWVSLQKDPAYIPPDAYISVDNKRFISYIELFQLPENFYKIQSYSVLNGRIDSTDIKEIPIQLFDSFTDRKLLRMKKIFVSYSKYDEDYLSDFEDHLVTLKQEGVATFNCKQIEFGKEWDQEIQKQIEECDIMVCLVSVKFLNTDYITKIEIPNAIAKNKIIVPIIIKACDWENSTLGKYQAAQRGKIVSLDNNLKLLGQIKAYTSEEKAAFWTDIVKEFRSKLLVP
jgi:internalin A